MNLDQLAAHADAIAELLAASPSGSIEIVDIPIEGPDDEPAASVAPYFANAPYVSEIARAAAEPVGRAYKAMLAAIMDRDSSTPFAPAEELEKAVAAREAEYDAARAAYVRAFPGIDPLFVFYGDM